MNKKTDVLLGVEMAGPNVSNLINEVIYPLEMCITVEELVITIYLHPTLPEVVQ